MSEAFSHESTPYRARDTARAPHRPRWTPVRLEPAAKSVGDPGRRGSDEVFQLRRHVASLKAEATQDFLRDGVRNIVGPVGFRG
jgi:hypothetical protein